MKKTEKLCLKKENKLLQQYVKKTKDNNDFKIIEVDAVTDFIKDKVGNL